MSCRIYIIYRIISAVRIQIKSVRCFGIKIACVVGRDKSTPLGAVVARVEIIKLCFRIVVVAAVSYRVFADYRNCTKGSSTVTPSIIGISANLVAVCIVNTNNVTEKITLEVDDYILTVFYANVNSR